MNNKFDDRETEKKSEIRNPNSEFDKNSLMHIIDKNADGIVILDPACIITFVNPAAEEIFGREQKELVGTEFGFPIIENEAVEINIIQKDHFVRFAEMRVVSTSWENERAFIISLRDITERKKLQSQLMQAQKMEAIGQLAAGIAHEINTPTQFIRHNFKFIQDSVNDISGLLEKYENLMKAMENNSQFKAIISEIQELSTTIDTSYLLKEMPSAVEESIGGIETIATIVKAMKAFSHPGSKEKENIDINKAIENTIIVSKNEWKYVCDLETDFCPNLPYIKGHAVELNQVFLNLIVNASHSINEKIQMGKFLKGLIKIQTILNNNLVEIKITDTGLGIPAHIQSQIFNPFFTTKEVGKGTGQGLSIAHSVVVNQHNGRISFETAEGEGTTFTISLPIDIDSHEGI